MNDKAAVTVNTSLNNFPYKTMDKTLNLKINHLQGYLELVQQSLIDYQNNIHSEFKEERFYDSICAIITKYENNE